MEVSINFLYQVVGQLYIEKAALMEQVNILNTQLQGVLEEVEQELEELRGGDDGAGRLEPGGDVGGHYTSADLPVHLGAEEGAHVVDEHSHDTDGEDAGRRVRDDPVVSESQQ